jgi:hypothetical protein
MSVSMMQTTQANIDPVIEKPVTIVAVVQQDSVHMSELFNVPWESVRRQLCDRIGFTSKDWEKNSNETDQQIDKIFSTSIPTGIDSEIHHILDQGYRIEVEDHGTRVKQLWITNGKDTQIYVRALNTYDAFAIGIDLFSKTLGAGLPFYFEEWFGEGKQYPNWLTGMGSHSSTLDWVLGPLGIDLILEKTAKGYKMTFENVRVSPKEQVDICFNRLTVC